MELRLGSVRLEIGFYFFVSIILFLLLDQSGLAVLCLGGMALHEGGHLLASALLGAGYNHIRFTPFGIRMTRPHHTRVSYGKEVAVSAAGSAANGLAALACACAVTVPDSVSSRFGAVNIVLCAFNLLPVAGLDGGSILRHLFLWIGPAHRAETVLRVISFLLLAVLSAVAWLLKNGSLAVLAVYLLGMLLAKKTV